MVFDAAILGCAMMCPRRKLAHMFGFWNDQVPTSRDRAYSCKLESRFEDCMASCSYQRTGVCLLIQASKKLFRLLHAAAGGSLIDRTRTGSDFRKPSIGDFEGLGYRRNVEQEEAENRNKGGNVQLF
jgi:hypothetical protein